MTAKVYQIEDLRKARSKKSFEALYRDELQAMRDVEDFFDDLFSDMCKPYDLSKPLFLIHPNCRCAVIDLSKGSENDKKD